MSISFSVSLVVGVPFAEVFDEAKSLFEKNGYNGELDFYLIENVSY